MATKLDKEWEARTLCSDGDCIGVVGPDGRCKVCGMSYDGPLPAPMDTTEIDGSDDGPVDMNDTVDTESDSDSPVTSPADAGDEWSDRTLCIDESCIGVVGPDGRCKECGKRHPGTPS